MKPIHVCIGAPRSGTTWLFNNMVDSDQIFLPCAKEVRFWWEARSHQEKSATIKVHRSEEGLSEKQRQWLDRWEELDESNLDTYIPLMSDKDLPSLDVSPQYAIMPLERIKKLHDVLPENSKVFFFARSHIERALSEVKLHTYMHGNFRGEADDGSIAQFASSDIIRKRNDYVATISNWRKVFGDRFKVFSYDDLNENQELFLKSIYSFLEIEPSISAFDKVRNYYGTDKGGKSIFPKFNERQKGYIARMVLPQAYEFSLVEPSIGWKWVDELRKTAEPFMLDDYPEEKRPVFDRLVRMCESLGDNCEFGFWQRSIGYEPSSLFRWAVTPIDALINYLESPKSLFWPDDIKKHTQDMVLDSGTGFYFHSCLADKASGELIRKDAFNLEYPKEKEKVDYLFEKFNHQLRLKPAVYVVKSNSGVTQEDAIKLKTVLQKYNSKHQLLYVTKGDKNGVISSDDGLISAKIMSFAPYDAANKINKEGWDKIFNELSELDVIRQLTNGMFV